MKNIFFTSILSLAGFYFSVAQVNMQEGFTYLETGKYKEAESFFETILKDHPTNKTAKLCFGRAIGLNGKTSDALTVFIELLSEYPNDFEIKLNYAESLLWNKQFIEAKNYYKNLVQEDSQSFPALLGYANTLSNLKEYDDAFEYVNKALKVSPGNANALTSKKYIRLGYAYQYQQKQEYENALELLNDNLVDFPLDRETLQNKANLYLIMDAPENAKQAYLQMAVNKKDSVIALNGLSLVLHMQNKEKKALKYSEKAQLKARSISDTLVIRQTTERHIQALIWNKKFKEAETNINTLLESKPNENWVLALHATLGMYRSDFNESIADYKQILENDSISFDGNLGIANAQFANGSTKNAYNAAFNTLNIFHQQKDAVSFLKKMNKNYTPYVEEILSYTFDNGDNKAMSSNTKIVFPFSTKFSTSATYNYRETENEVTKNIAHSNNFSLGIVYKLRPKITFNSIIGINKASSFSNNYTQFLTNLFFKMQPLKLQNLELGYKREIENFNADLLDKKIITDNFYLNHNIGSNFKLGWYTQYLYTTQSDNNTRHLLFTSLYYNFLSKPVLKGGINYQHISFKNQLPTTYFSPKTFNAAEIFIELSESVESLFYNLSIATGYQFIEKSKKQFTYRFQAKLGYEFSSRFLSYIYGQHTNVASATAAGFTFTELGLSLKWYITKNPIFIKKLKAL